MKKSSSVARLGLSLVSLLSVIACSRVGIDGYPDLGTLGADDATSADDTTVGLDTAVAPDTAADASDAGGPAVEPGLPDADPTVEPDVQPVEPDVPPMEQDADPGQPPELPEVCDDGIDNDGDGLVDCADTAECRDCGDNSCMDDVERLGSSEFFFDQVLEAYAVCEGEGDAIQQCFFDVFSDLSGADGGCSSCLAADAACVSAQCSICLETRFDDRRCERCLDRVCNTRSDACF